MTARTPADIVALLERATVARDELRQTIRDAHAARKDLRQDVVASRERVATALEAEVTRQVHALTEIVLTELRDAASAAIDELVRDWRAKLGL